MPPTTETKEHLFAEGLSLLNAFCVCNQITPPSVTRTSKDNPDPLLRRYYHVGSCAFYRDHKIFIAVDRCAYLGMGGRAWSWPAYTIDRTPYGVLQHELGHHVDWLRGDQLSRQIYEASKEQPMTGYLGTDKEDLTFYKEWFAENFRVFVTNPELAHMLRPKFCDALVAEGIRPVIQADWKAVLQHHNATDRIINQAQKKIDREKAV